jgi:hypothetical protein
MTNDNSNETLRLDRAFYELAHLLPHYQRVYDEAKGKKLTIDTLKLKQIHTYSRELTNSLYGVCSPWGDYWQLPCRMKMRGCRWMISRT